MEINGIFDLVQKILFWAGASIKGQIIFKVVSEWLKKIFG